MTFLYVLFYILLQYLCMFYIIYTQKTCCFLQKYLAQYNPIYLAVNMWICIALDFNVFLPAVKDFVYVLLCLWFRFGLYSSVNLCCRTLVLFNACTKLFFVKETGKKSHFDQLYGSIMRDSL